MRKVLVNYANGVFREAQKLNSETALKTAGFDEVRSFQYSDIDRGFAAKNRQILKADRGDGYWLWKPYFIQRVLAEMAEGEYLFYCDSGSHFIHPIQPLIDLCESNAEEIVVFELRVPESAWTKRDAFVLLDCDQPRFFDAFQRLSSFHLWKKCERSMTFVSEWLQAMQDPRISTAADNQCGLPNFPGYQEHRFDQSALSLLSKKHGLTAYRDPSQWGNECVSLYANSPYPQMIQHTRNRTQERLLLKFLRKLLRPLQR